MQVDGAYFQARLEQLEQMPTEVRGLDEQRKVMTHDVGTLERKLAKMQLAVQELLQVGRGLTNKEQRKAALARDIAAIPAGYDSTRHTFLKAEVERLTPLDARAARLGALVEREPQLARERARVEATAAGVFVRFKEMRARRDSIRFSEAAYQAVRAVRARGGRSAEPAEIAAVTSRARGRCCADRGRTRRGRSAVRWTSCRPSSMRCSGTSACTMSWIGRFRSAHGSQLRAAPGGVGARERLPERPHRRTLRELELDDQYNIIVLEDGRAQAGDLGRRGGSRAPRAAPGDLADDRRASGPVVLSAHPGRGVRLARRRPAAQRGGAACVDCTIDSSR